MFRTTAPASILGVVLAAFLALPALAHTGLGGDHGFLMGVAHPLLGLDHVLAAAAVGLWAGLVGGRMVWVWPASFVTTMLAGAGIGLAGFSPPGVELAIAASVAVLGLAVAMQLSLPLIAGAALCGAFALMHGFAHGAELPAGARVLDAIAGLTFSTVLLHLAGIVLGRALFRIDRVWIPGLAGGAVAATGLVLLVT
jgi:urease accessory protein